VLDEWTWLGHKTLIEGSKGLSPSGHASLKVVYIFERKTLAGGLHRQPDRFSCPT